MTLPRVFAWLAFTLVCAVAEDAGVSVPFGVPSVLVFVVEATRWKAG